jgi:adenylate cyclase, class 2
MLEIELKFRLSNVESRRIQLIQLGGALAGTWRETDEYYCPPDRNYKDTDEAFRLRFYGDRAVLTYKGPKKTSTVTKSRTEIEVPLAIGPRTVSDAKKLLLALRFRSVAVVDKMREMYTLTRDSFEVNVCLDSVLHIGDYIEIEIVAHESDQTAAEAVVHQLSKELQLADSIPQSYLNLILDRVGSEP